MNKTAKILAAVGAAAASAAALTVSTVSDYAINDAAKMFADRTRGLKHLCLRADARCR